MSVLLIDTYSVFFRSFHALPPMTTRAGEPTGALYGFSTLLLKLMREQEPEGIALALDRPEPTFRHRLDPSYKANRPALPSDLVRQLRTLDRLLEALAVPCFSVSGFEADDVLATLCHALREADVSICIASGDRDLLQLVSPHVEVLFLGQRGKPATRYDEAAVQARFGLGPRRLPLYVSLIGDSADNVPKLPGIGPVAAQKLCAQYADSEALLAHLDEVSPPRTREILRAHADQLRASEQLVRLRTDVPLPPGALYGLPGPDALAALRVLFEELEFKSLLPRLDALAKA